jgi:hypothetical protein
MNVAITEISVEAFPLRPFGPPPPITGEEYEMCPSVAAKLGRRSEPRLSAL